MTASTSYRLVIPVPDGGWLSLCEPESAEDRLSLAEDWRLMAKSCVAVSGLPELGRVIARVECRPRRLADRGEVGIHSEKDLRPSWELVRAVLGESGIRVFRERLVLGPSTGDNDPLMVVTFREVPDG